MLTKRVRYYSNYLCAAMHVTESGPPRDSSLACDSSLAVVSPTLRVGDDEYGVMQRKLANVGFIYYPTHIGG